MSSGSPYILYGVPHSLYTAKARCYLRNQGIDYIERATSHPDYAARIVPQIQRAIIPVLETPDGEIIQDTIDIIDYFERRGVPWPAYPSTPLQHSLAIIIEYYGGQAMLKHAMHYRWSYLEEQEHFLRHAFESGSGAAMAEAIMGRMQSYLPRLGVTEKSIPLIEGSYERLLDLLDVHFQQLPYLLGGRPSIADYGMIGTLFAHLGRDPVPSEIMKLRAPRVFRWVERMTAPNLDVVEYTQTMPEFWPDDDIPPTLIPLLHHIAEEIFPELTDKLAFIDTWVQQAQPADGAPATDKPHKRQLGMVQTSFRGVSVEAGVEPYLLFMLQRGAAELEALPVSEAQRVQERLREVGLEQALPLKLGYGITRKDNLEVWRR